MSFESIFTQNNEVDPNLDALFKKKAPKNIRTDQILSAIADATTAENTATESPSNAAGTKPQAPSTRASSRLNRKAKPQRDDEEEARTIFIGNIPSETKKEELLKLFKSYGKVESIRFRNIVPEDITKTKKFAFITKQKHSLKKTINAFLRFKDIDAAKQSLEVNGSVFKEHHLRVDLSLQGKAHDNKTSVFLGGLPFDTEEESVYKHFEDCGPIDNVRLIRDNKTGIGKGIGYVCFKSADAINLALKLNGCEINGRRIRVARCVKKLVVVSFKRLVRFKKVKFLFKKANKVQNGKAKSDRKMKKPVGDNQPKKRAAAMTSTSVEGPKRNFKDKFQDKKKKTIKKKPQIKTNKKESKKIRL